MIMNRLFIKLCGIAAISMLLFSTDAAAKKKPLELKVGSYNLCTSGSRVKQIKSGKFTSQQKYWCNSAESVAAMIADLDCDIMGFQEVCDSIWGVKGELGIQKLVAEKRGADDYEWVLFPNTGKKKISYDDAICYKKDVFTELGSGIFWLGGNPEKPIRVEGAPKGTNRPAVWVWLKHKKSGKKFYFICTHLVLGTMHKDGGNEYNAEQFVQYADYDLVPSNTPSIVVGDFNSAPLTPKEIKKAEKEGKTPENGFTIMTSSRWKDAFLALKEAGKLEENELMAGTQPKKDESGFGKWYPDHIMYSKEFEPKSFKIDRRMFPTKDGSMHFPSDHLPIVSILTLK